MKKIILLISLIMNGQLIFAQKAADSKPIMFFKAGAGFGSGLATLPTPLVQEGQRQYYSSLRAGLNLNFQMGFNINEKSSLGLVYNLLSTSADQFVAPNTWQGNERINFIGLTYQQYVPVGTKNNVNFIAKAGPGVIVYRSTNSIIAAGRTTSTDASRNALGFYTAAGADFKINNNFRFELTLDGNWGRVDRANVVKDADVLSLNGGFVLQIR